MLTSRCFYYMIFMSYWFCTGKKNTCVYISKVFIFKILHWPTQLVQNQKQYQYIMPRRLNIGTANCKNILLLITLSFGISVAIKHCCLNLLLAFWDCNLNLWHKTILLLVQWSKCKSSMVFNHYVEKICFLHC